VAHFAVSESVNNQRPPVSTSFLKRLTDADSRAIPERMTSQWLAES
jgi:hypothetical protein